MAADFPAVFEALKAAFGQHPDSLIVQTDTPSLYNLVGRVPSPYPQHKGQPMWFGAVRMGKAYVSFHLMPLYMNPPLESLISPALKRRMQGKTCFNFKAVPEPALLEDLKELVEAALQDWTARKYL
ncbi:MAG: hypothetical protein P4L26_15395 [Terracidiphilus sp.]|jgi:hypothetical protein|nr:hypothetical protein [Terracidiphilus sp.]